VPESNSDISPLRLESARCTEAQSFTIQSAPACAKSVALGGLQRNDARTCRFPRANSGWRVFDYRKSAAAMPRSSAPFLYGSGSGFSIHDVV